jgi:ATP-dependent helicase/nuclease subunit B
MTASLQDFTEIQVGWMREQYRFKPVDVELPFGEDGISPWTVGLEPADQSAALTSGAGATRFARLELVGRIDRVDLFRDPAADEAYCVVVDYKSSHKQLDPVLLANGLQLQLLTYLNVMRDWPNPRERFGVARLVPAGVFYVSLRGKYDREQNRLDALANTEQARKRAYRHAGRFDARALRLLDARPDARQGDQFSYRLNNDGQIHKHSREALTTIDFETLLNSAKMNLRRMGREIFAGVAKVAPYRKGTVTACDQCDYRAICRVDPWTHSFRMLRAGGEAAD